jgi:hypothetical protein
MGDAMKTEVERRQGECPTHGPVEGTREIPRMGFPFIYYSVLRWRARKKPFVCPTCETPLAK